MFGQMRSALGIDKSTDILDHLHSLSGSEQDEARADIEAIERDAMSKQTPQPGLESLMEYLDSQGIRKAICIRNFEYASIVYAVRYALLIRRSAPVAHLLANHVPGHVKDFSPIITREFKPPKPSPAGILHIAHTWGITDSAVVPQTPAQDRPLPLIMVTVPGGRWNRHHADSL